MAASFFFLANRAYRAKSKPEAARPEPPTARLQWAPVAGDLTAAVAVFLGLVFFVPLLFVLLPALKGTMFCFSSVLTNWPLPVAAFTV